MADIQQLPPIHSSHHHLSKEPRPHSVSTTSSKSHRKRPTTRGSNTAHTSSPEIISSLITSLSSISSPAGDFYDSLLPNASAKTTPVSPTGSRSRSIREDVISENASQHQSMLFSDEAAGPPVVRTNKARSGVTSLPPPKRYSSQQISYSTSGPYTTEQMVSIGNISIEPRYVPPMAEGGSPSHSRTNSVRSSTFRESKERMRSLERRSRSRLRESGGQSPALSKKSSIELVKEENGPAVRISKRAKSMYATPSSSADYHTPATVNGLSVPTRDSSKRHSFQSHRSKKSKTKSIREDPLAEAAEDGSTSTLDNIDDSIEQEIKEVSEKIQAFKEQKEAVESIHSGSKSPMSQRTGSIPLMATRTSSARTGLLSSPTVSDPSWSRSPVVESKSRSSFSRSLTEPVPQITNRRSNRPPPSIADSIDDAIEDYLDNPKLSQKVRDPVTGRVITFSEVGDPTGSAVFCCVGMGTTRFLTAFYDELAITLKLRLITPDRPGIGESEPYPEGLGTPLTWPDDIRTICGHLDIQRFSVLAHSAGAVYALATALRMPQHIRGRIHLLAPWIPPSQMVAVGIQKDQSPITTLPYSQRLLRSLPTSLFKIANSSIFAMTSSSIASAMPAKSKRQKRRSTNDEETPKEKTIFKSRRNSLQFADGLAQDAKPDIMETASSPRRQSSIMSRNKLRESEYEYRLIHAIWDAATTNANPAVDLIVCLERRHDIGFRYADINKEVIIHHGSKDSRVPVENVEWLGRRMRRCEVKVLEGENHGLMASAKVMSDVLAEISQEWESWNAIIGRKH